MRASRITSADYRRLNEAAATLVDISARYGGFSITVDGKNWQIRPTPREKKKAEAQK